jgi:SAM-dependent methyltransferase
LSSIEDDYFDFVATYSVLHHIPDYMKAVAEMIRVVKPGGVVYLDHEPCDSYWQKNEEYEKFLSSLPKRKKTIKRFFVLSNYTNKIRRLINPRYEPEGDIHIWGDDHIEWDKIEKYAKSNGCSVVIKEDYLLYKRGYPEDLYQLYKNRCQDMTVLVLRKDDLPKRKK